MLWSELTEKYSLSYFRQSQSSRHTYSIHGGSTTNNRKLLFLEWEKMWSEGQSRCWKGSGKLQQQWWLPMLCSILFLGRILSTNQGGFQSRLSTLDIRWETWLYNWYQISTIPNCFYLAILFRGLFFHNENTIKDWGICEVKFIIYSGPTKAGAVHPSFNIMWVISRNASVTKFHICTLVELISSRYTWPFNRIRKSLIWNYNYNS